MLFHFKRKMRWNISKVNGKMHACGHDGHTTNLLYFAKWLKEQMDSGVELKKSIMLIFQAGEEGKGGARFIAQSDIFKNKNLKESLLCM